MGTLMNDPASILVVISKVMNSFCDTFESDARAFDIDKKENNAIVIATANKSLIVAYDCNIQQEINNWKRLDFADD